MIFIPPETSSFLSVSRALSLSSSLDKLKSEYVDLKHQVAESIINPARLSIEELQGELKTEVMYKDDKKYHMDLKENARGRFLKVSETNGHSRFHVFIPADGMREFKQNIGELIDDFDTGTGGYGNF